jgi:predicted DNA-binding protein (UPF0278 family)
MKNWIKIKNEVDSLEENKMYKFIPCNDFDKEFIGWIDKKHQEVFFVDFDYYVIQKSGNTYSATINAWLFSQITHYSDLVVSTAVS